MWAGMCCDGSNLTRYTYTGYAHQHELAVKRHGADSFAATSSGHDLEAAKDALHLLRKFQLTESALRLGTKYRHFPTLVRAELLLEAAHLWL